MKINNIFYGIDLIYNSVHMDEDTLSLPEEGSVIEIQHCREGRIEQQIEDEFYYLMPGDLSVTIKKGEKRHVTFPLKHYHGITITIDTEKAPKCFSCFLKDVNVQPMTVAQKLCGDKKCFIIRNEDYVEHIFSELYSVPETIRKGYMKIKILELLLVLSGIDIESEKVKKVSLSESQVCLAKEVSDYLATVQDTKISVNELALKFHVSKSHLQSAFKGVYGTSVFSYMRILKMQKAAVKLTQSRLSVLEIANQCGYDNASKFAAAFKEVMGENPVEYRKGHSFVLSEHFSVLSE